MCNFFHGTRLTPKRYSSVRTGRSGCDWNAHCDHTHRLWYRICFNRLGLKVSNHLSTRGKTRWICFQMTSPDTKGTVFTVPTWCACAWLILYEGFEDLSCWTRAKVKTRWLWQLQDAHDILVINRHKFRYNNFVVFSLSSWYWEKHWCAKWLIIKP